MIRSVFLIAGELSADRYAAHLVRALRQRIPHLHAEAIGGPNLRAAGVPLFRDSSEWSAIGVAEALRRLPPIWLGQKALKRRLRASPLDLLIPLDFGAFNVPTATYARSFGIPVCYAVPPGSWRPDGGRVSPKLAACADAYLTPFAPSERKLREAGLDAHWMGHPLLDFLPDAAAKEESRKTLGLETGAKVMALLPGSRGQEIRHLTPVLLEAAHRQVEQNADLQLVLPLASGQNTDNFFVLLRNHGWKDSPSSMSSPASAPHENPPPPPRFQRGHARLTLAKGRAIETLAISDAALVCSGTATLEAALVGCPMVIGYKGGGATSIEYWLRKSIVPKYIGLPNLLLDRSLCPELLAEECTPEGMEAAVKPLLSDTSERAAQLEGFTELRTRLGEPGVIDRWADYIVDRWGKESSPSPAEAGRRDA